MYDFAASIGPSPPSTGVSHIDAFGTSAPSYANTRRSQTSAFARFNTDRLRDFYRKPPQDRFTRATSTFDFATNTDAEPEYFTLSQPNTTTMPHDRTTSISSSLGSALSSRTSSFADIPRRLSANPSYGSCTMQHTRADSTSSYFSDEELLMPGPGAYKKITKQDDEVAMSVGAPAVGPTEDAIAPSYHLDEGMQAMRRKKQEQMKIAAMAPRRRQRKSSSGDAAAERATQARK